jgi:hypothetical protein
MPSVPWQSAKAHIPWRADDKINTSCKGPVPRAFPFVRGLDQVPANQLNLNWLSGMCRGSPLAY